MDCFVGDVELRKKAGESFLNSKISTSVEQEREKLNIEKNRGI